MESNEVLGEGEKREENLLRIIKIGKYECIV